MTPKSTEYLMHPCTLVQVYACTAFYLLKSLMQAFSTTCPLNFIIHPTNGVLSASGKSWTLLAISIDVYDFKYEDS